MCKHEAPTTTAAMSSAPEKQHRGNVPRRTIELKKAMSTAAMCHVELLNSEKQHRGSFKVTAKEKESKEHLC
jgi:hypothetical protein